MPRLNYSAPGVYVEEVPSARQPIAGVGTNTVGFIGIVPPRVWCPVVNPQYDPVEAAKAAKQVAEQPQPAAPQSGSTAADLDKRLRDAKAELENANSALKKLDAGADKAAAEKKVADANAAMTAAQAAKAAQEARQAAATTATPESDAAYKSNEPPPEWRLPAAGADGKIRTTTSGRTTSCRLICGPTSSTPSCAPTSPNTPTCSALSGFGDTGHCSRATC
jgi:hypothetical protein